MPLGSDDSQDNTVRKPSLPARSWWRRVAQLLAGGAIFHVVGWSWVAAARSVTPLANTLNLPWWFIALLLGFVQGTISTLGTVGLRRLSAALGLPPWPKTYAEREAQQQQGRPHPDLGTTASDHGSD